MLLFLIQIPKQANAGIDPANRDSLLVFYFNQDVVAVDFHVMGSRVLSRRHAECLSCANIKFRPVTWTLNFTTLMVSVTERSAIMRANIIDAKKIIRDPEQNHESIIGFDEHFCSVGKITPVGQFDKFTHKIPNWIQDKILTELPAIP